MSSQSARPRKTIRGRRHEGRLEVAEGLDDYFGAEGSDDRRVQAFLEGRPPFFSHASFSIEDRGGELTGD